MIMTHASLFSGIGGFDLAVAWYKENQMVLKNF